MRLQTSRLIIRDWQPEQDAEAAIAIYGTPAVTQWIGEKSVDDTAAKVQARLQRYRDRSSVSPGLGCWAVESRQGIIGTLLLVPLPNRENVPSGHIEIGWHFCPESWGQGYATEAARAVMIRGFEALKLPEIYAVAMLDNDRSVRVMQRLGMSDLGISDDYHGGARLRLFRRSATDSEPAS